MGSKMRTDADHQKAFRDAVELGVACSDCDGRMYFTRFAFSNSPPGHDMIYAEFRCDSCERKMGIITGHRLPLPQDSQGRLEWNAKLLKFERQGYLAYLAKTIYPGHHPHYFAYLLDAISPRLARYLRRPSRPVRIFKSSAGYWGITNWSVGTNTFPSSWVQLSGFGLVIQIKWYIVVPLVLLSTFACGALSAIWYLGRTL